MTLTSLTYDGVTVADACRTAQYDSLGAYTAAVAADDYTPPAALIGRDDCTCADCPDPAASLWPYDPAEPAPWVGADRPDSLSLWDIRTVAWERQTALVEAEQGCAPSAWRWEVELVGDHAGRAHGVTWLAQRLHATAACRAGSCRGCGAADLEVAENCGPVRTIRDATVVVLRTLPDEATECTTRVEVLWEAADGRQWDAPELVESFDADDWGAAECSPLHPLNVDCDCVTDPCAPSTVQWGTLAPGCIVVPGEGDESVLTRAIQSPEESAFYDLTAAGLRAPFQVVSVYDVTSGTVDAAPSGVVWTPGGGGASHTATVDVTDADGTSCRLRLGLLTVFCRDPIVNRPAFDSTATLVRAAQEGYQTQPYPAVDTATDPPDPRTIPTDWIAPDLTPATNPKPATPAAPALPASAGVEIIATSGATTTRGGTVAYTWSARNTGDNASAVAVDNATIKVWLPEASDPTTAVFTSTASGTATGAAPVLVSNRYYEITGVNIPGGGGNYIAGSLTIDHDGSDTSLGPVTIEIFPTNASANLGASDSDTAPSPPLSPTNDSPAAWLDVRLTPSSVLLAKSGNLPGTVWQAYLQNATSPQAGYPTSGNGVAISGATLRVWRPAEVTSWTITPTAFGGAAVGAPSDFGRYYDIVGVSIPADPTAYIIVDVANVTRDAGSGDVSDIVVEILSSGDPTQLAEGASSTAPGPVLPVEPDPATVTGYVNASLSRDVLHIERGATIAPDVWSVFVAANGTDSITGGVLRIDMPDGVAAWQWSVNTTGLVTFSDTSPSGGLPYIELSDLVIGNNAASYLVVTISNVRHNDSLDDVGNLTAELFGGFFTNLPTTTSDTAPGPTLGPCPPTRWYEDETFSHATVVTDADGVAHWTWGDAIGPVTGTATNGTLSMNGPGFLWQSFSTDQTGVVTLSDSSGRQAIVAIAAGPRAPSTAVGCDTIIAPPTAPADDCDTWCEPFMRRTLFFTVDAESTDYAALLRFTVTPATVVGVRAWVDAATCPPELEACPPADTLVGLDLPGVSITTLSPDVLRVATFGGTCEAAIRGLPEIRSDCGDVCVGLTIAGDATPPELVEVLSQTWVE